MSDFFETIQKRRSVHAYSKQALEEGLLPQVLEAARLAPSAGNLQAYEIYLISSQANRATLAEAALNQDFIAQAPVSLVFCTNAGRSSIIYGERGSRLYCVQDATIAATFAMLAAGCLGLATAWVGAFDARQVAKACDAPAGQHPVVILVLGYGAESPPDKPRRSLEELVHQEKQE